MWRWSTKRVAFNIKPINTFIFSKKNYCDRKKWDILFFGTDEFSLASLKVIHQEYVNKGIINKLEVVATTSGSNKAMLKYAKKHNLYTHNWPLSPNLDNKFHLGIVVSFGRMIPKKIINIFPLGMLNVHASLLPRWRGAAPIIHCLLNGDTHTGVSIMRIKPHHFDIGDVIKQKVIEINKDMFQPELHKLLASIGANSLMETLNELPECLNNAKLQDSSKATNAPKVHESLAVIDWEKCSALQIHNQSRALLGVYPLITRFKGKEVQLKKIHLWKEESSEIDLKKTPGQFEFMKLRRVIRVCCGDHKYVYFESIKVKGKPEMKVFDFKNGFMKLYPVDHLKFDCL